MVYIKKALVLIVALSLVTSNAYGYGGATLFKQKSHAQRYLADEAQKDRADIVASPSALGISQNLGQVVEWHKADAGADKLVIHIQDHHTDPIAQLNIAGIMGELLVQDNVDLFCLEGASKELDSSFFDQFTNKHVKEKIAKAFLQKGLFTGAEYYKITHDDIYVDARGAEDKALYLKNLASYKKNQPGKEERLRQLASITRALNQLKQEAYSKDLKKIDAVSTGHALKQTGLPEYLKTLAQYAKKTKTDMSAYKDLKDFLILLDEEEEINFQKAEEQRESLIKALTKTLKEEELEGLVVKSLNFRLSKISTEAFYAYLNALLINTKQDKAPYKDLLAYIDYLKFSKTINHLNVFDEAEALEGRIEAALCKNSTQRDIAAYSKATKLLGSLYSLKITRRHLDYLENNPDICNIARMEAFLKDTCPRYGLTAPSLGAVIPAANLNVIPAKAGIQGTDTAQPLTFYKLALERDKALVDNTLKNMKRHKKDKAVLITGGFHTQGITHILKEKNISYVVMCPNIGPGNYEKIYQQRMAGGLPSVAELLEVAYQTLVPALTLSSIQDPELMRNIEEAFRMAYLAREELARLHIGTAVRREVVEELVRTITKYREMTGALPPPKLTAKMIKQIASGVTKPISTTPPAVRTDRKIDPPVATKDVTRGILLDATEFRPGDRIIINGGKQKDTTMVVAGRDNGTIFCLAALDEATGAGLPGFIRHEAPVKSTSVRRQLLRGRARVERAEEMDEIYEHNAKQIIVISLNNSILRKARYELSNPVAYYVNGLVDQEGIVCAIGRLEDLKISRPLRAEQRLKAGELFEFTVKYEIFDDKDAPKASPFELVSVEGRHGYTPPDFAVQSLASSVEATNTEYRINKQAKAVARAYAETGVAKAASSGAEDVTKKILSGRPLQPGDLIVREKGNLIVTRVDTGSVYCLVKMAAAADAIGTQEFVEGDMPLDQPMLMQRLSDGRLRVLRGGDAIADVEGNTDVIFSKETQNLTLKIAASKAGHPNPPDAGSSDAVDESYVSLTGVVNASGDIEAFGEPETFEAQPELQLSQRLEAGELFEFTMRLIIADELTNGEPRFYQLMDISNPHNNEIPSTAAQKLAFSIHVADAMLRRNTRANASLYPVEERFVIAIQRAKDGDPEGAIEILNDLTALPKIDVKTARATLQDLLAYSRVEQSGIEVLIEGDTLTQTIDVFTKSQEINSDIRHIYVDTGDEDTVAKRLLNSKRIRLTLERIAEPAAKASGAGKDKQWDLYVESDEEAEVSLVSDDGSVASVTVNAKEIAGLSPGWDVRIPDGADSPDFSDEQLSKMLNVALWLRELLESLSNDEIEAVLEAATGEKRVYGHDLTKRVYIEPLLEYAYKDTYTVIFQISRSSTTHDACLAVQTEAPDAHRAMLEEIKTLMDYGGKSGIPRFGEQFIMRDGRHKKYAYFAERDPGEVSEIMRNLHREAEESTLSLREARIIQALYMARANDMQGAQAAFVDTSDSTEVSREAARDILGVIKKHSSMKARGGTSYVPGQMSMTMDMLAEGTGVEQPTQPELNVMLNSERVLLALEKISAADDSTATKAPTSAEELFVAAMGQVSKAFSAQGTDITAAATHREEAVALFRQTVAADPSNSDAWKALCRQLGLLGKVDEARKAAAEASKVFDGRDEGLYVHFMNLAMSGEGEAPKTSSSGEALMDEAGELMARAHAHETAHSIDAADRADMLRKARGLRTQAIGKIEQALETEDGRVSYDAWAMYIEQLDITGRTEEAKRAAAQAIEVLGDPAHSEDWRSNRAYFTRWLGELEARYPSAHREAAPYTDAEIVQQRQLMLGAWAQVREACGADIERLKEMSLEEFAEGVGAKHVSEGLRKVAPRLAGGYKAFYLAHDEYNRVCRDQPGARETLASFGLTSGGVHYFSENKVVREQLRDNRAEAEAEIRRRFQIDDAGRLFATTKWDVFHEVCERILYEAMPKSLSRMSGYTSHASLEVLNEELEFAALFGPEESAYALRLRIAILKSDLRAHLEWPAPIREQSQQFLDLLRQKKQDTIAAWEEFSIRATAKLEGTFILEGGAAKQASGGTINAQEEIAMLRQSLLVSAQRLSSADPSDVYGLHPNRYGLVLDMVPEDEAGRNALETIVSMSTLRGDSKFAVYVMSQKDKDALTNGWSPGARERIMVVEDKDVAETEFEPGMTPRQRRIIRATQLLENQVKSIGIVVSPITNEQKIAFYMRKQQRERKKQARPEEEDKICGIFISAQEIEDGEGVMFEAMLANALISLRRVAPADVMIKILPPITRPEEILRKLREMKSDLEAVLEQA